jgi:hypothetical protein
LLKIEKNTTSPASTNRVTKNINHIKVEMTFVYDFELTGINKNTTNGKINIAILEKSNLKPFKKLKNISLFDSVEK